MYGIQNLEHFNLVLCNEEKLITCDALLQIKNLLHLAAQNPVLRQGINAAINTQIEPVSFWITSIGPISHYMLDFDIGTYGPVPSLALNELPEEAELRIALETSPDNRPFFTVFDVFIKPEQFDHVLITTGTPPIYVDIVSANEAEYLYKPHLTGWLNCSWH